MFLETANILLTYWALRTYLTACYLIQLIAFRNYFFVALMIPLK